MTQTVKVRFKNGNGSASTRCYNYICEFPVQAGDVAVVDSPIEGLCCVDVESVHDFPDSKATKYVVQVIDMTAYEKRQEIERRKKVVHAELEHRLKNVHEIMKYEMLAKMDPSAAVLVEELKRLAA